VGIKWMRNIKPIARRVGSTEGAEIAEAALVLPLVVMLLLGIIWFGRVFNIYSTITQAAQQGAITAARAGCASCPAGSGWPGNASFPSNSTVDNAIFAVLRASSVDPGQIPVNSNPPTVSSCGIPPLTPPLSLPLECTTTNNITICRNALLKPSASAIQSPQCGVVVSFQYPFQFYLPFTSLNFQTIVLSAQAQSRMEY
jgi:TadE-like protein